MKIGYFIGHFPYKNLLNKDIVNYTKRYSHDGGVDVVNNLAVDMAKRGHEINVFTTSIDFRDAIERYNNISVYRYGTNFRIASANFSFNLFLKPIRHKVDVIHTHVGNPISDLAGYVYMKRNNSLPSIITYHGDLQEDMGGLIRRVSVYFYNKYLLDKVLSYADVIISPSENYIDESRFLGKYRNKIVVIPNGINVEDFDIGYSKEECREKLGLPLDEEIILFLGTLSQHKGPDILLKAMPKILKDTSKAKLVFVGDGRMREELEALSKRLGIDEYVEFAGFVKEELKPLYYKAADVFCLPSVMKHESFGIVNLEAMACGIPIVASKIGGVPDVVKDGENGLLVQPRDSGALADGIIYLLENEEVQKKMGMNGRRKVEDYSWERIAEMTEKVYSEVIS
jgi:glycosyltransferase involved in cell wall biosynthesis